MENLVNALRIAFAVFIFMIGLVMLFSMASQAKNTADTLIEKIDKTTYYSSYTTGGKIDANGNRIVRMEDIIPVLYRYAQENYGVTIVDKSKNIVARFDLDTEVACNNWLDLSKYSKYKFITETNTIFEKVNQIANSTKVKLIDVTTSPPNPTETTDIISITEKMTNLFKKLYKQNKTGSREYYCGWLGSMEWTAQRIDSDLSRY